ncbi:MAG TPA: phosphotransferase [Gammaproteobacteria bacterium]|nr:phosphotransferase [Gammaproteobacteria bacterium]
MQPDRQQELTAWVAGTLKVAAPVLVPASADASFRRYFRTSAGGRSYVVMDAPPPQEDCRPFVRIAGLMQEAGVHVPAILAEDVSRGFLLLEDLGTRTYLDVFKEVAADADHLFQDALASLVLWQKASRGGVLPNYDRALLHRELMLYPDWYVTKHLKLELNALEMVTLQDAFRLLEDSALVQTQVYVHRDYMPRNLMLSEPNPGVLDFQDAVHGPLTYDVASLFKDAFLSWPEERVVGWRRLYRERALKAGLPVPGLAEFERAFDWMGMQRHLKVMGIFARINYRDGKPHYLKDTPRFLSYIRETGKRYQEFTSLLRLMDDLERRAPRAVEP